MPARPAARQTPNARGEQQSIQNVQRTVQEGLQRLFAVGDIDRVAACCDRRPHLLTTVRKHAWALSHRTATIDTCRLLKMSSPIQQTPSEPQSPSRKNPKALRPVRHAQRRREEALERQQSAREDATARARKLAMEAMRVATAQVGPHHLKCCVLTCAADQLHQRLIAANSFAIRKNRPAGLGYGGRQWGCRDAADIWAPCKRQWRCTCGVRPRALVAPAHAARVGDRRAAEPRL
jgi:hypothetical protein